MTRPIKRTEVPIKDLLAIEDITPCDLAMVCRALGLFATSKGWLRQSNIASLIASATSLETLQRHRDKAARASKIQHVTYTKPKSAPETIQTLLNAVRGKTDFGVEAQDGEQPPTVPTVPAPKRRRKVDTLLKG